MEVIERALLEIVGAIFQLCPLLATFYHILDEIR